MGRQTYDYNEDRDPITGVTRLEIKAVLPCGASYTGQAFATEPGLIPACKANLEKTFTNTWSERAQGND